MADRKIRMATSDNDSEQGHTIVGGRPQAPRSMRADIPRGLEILVKRAAIDATFKSALLEKREKIADELQIPLDASEKAMLACIPGEQLEKMIKATEVPPAQHKLLARGTAAAMLALLAQLTFAPVPGRAEAPPKINLRPATSRSENDEYAVVKGIRPDLENEDHLADRGARPDFPGPVLTDDDDIIFTDTDPDGIESTEPTAPEFAKVVNVSITGKKLRDAIKAIEEDTGLTIIVSGIEERLADYVVESDINGLPVKMAIETICLETSSEACEFDIIWQNDPPSAVINFQEILETPTTDNDLNGVLPAVKPAPTKDDSAIIRGIRSDFPEIRQLDDKDKNK
ncbi:MAG: hypothetical protein CVV42_12835 [Candidatus Riflebacteria bacterium HGW-Riflebacteria-2]|nr:MAG: hypothetical protein CVV42_12835 [Candidatus Riflebacteria bacterium HGW-Riflebacteria-2]